MANIERIEPYNIVFYEHITYYAKVYLDDGSCLDIKSPTELTINEWTTLAESIDFSTPLIPAQISTNEDSSIVIVFKNERDQLKTYAIQYIMMNPTCTKEELLSSYTQTGIIDKSAFLDLYISETFNNGFIPENSFTVFRNWILTLTYEQLMSL